MFFLYRIGIYLYIFAVWFASKFNQKAEKAINGRRRSREEPNPFSDELYVWFHCASLGEFEQGRPVIEAIKRKYPSQKVLLTFYSPSGYEVRKKYDGADVVVYMPFDTSKNASCFLDKYKIKVAIFVKYEIWPNFFAQLNNGQVPIYIISAVFRKNHWYFKWYGRFVKELLKGVKTIFVQDKDSLNILHRNGLNNTIVAGDARIDRVLEIKNSIQPIDRVEQFLQGEKAVVFGSIYPSDREVLLRVIQDLPPDIKLIIAPHNVDSKMIDFLKSILTDYSIWSTEMDKGSNRILIIDNVGNLNKVYQYASMAYIGGGFERNIHNILEPAVFNIPICFGPKHQKFPEAQSLIDSGLAFSNNDPNHIAGYISKILTMNGKAFSKQDSIQWFEKHSGATSLIINEINVIV